MEINPNDKILGSVYQEETINTEKPADKIFGVIFEEFIENSTKIDKKSEKTSAITNISAIQMTPFLSGGKMSVVERAEKLLDTLDVYRQKLSSAEVALRDISPLIMEMEAENKTLGSAVNSLSDGDELKDIINQVIITSSIEIIKFNRGDYVNP